MLKTIKASVIICLLSAMTLGVSMPASAQEKAAPKGEAKEKGEGKKRDTYPFTGKITSVDKVNKTILLNGKDGDRVLNISSATKLFKGGKPATLEEAVAGEEASGQAHKLEGGKVEALSVYLGPKPEGKGGEKKKKEKKDDKKEEKKTDAK